MVEESLSQFVQFGLIILIVLAFSLLMRILRQPLIIGYILSGILAGPLFFNLVGNNEMVSLFSKFGIAFLLFIVGLHLSPRVIKEVGKISVITGIGQIIFTAVVGYFIATLFGFPFLTALYISIALTFSSTIIVLKLLSDDENLDTLYGKISVGFLLVQDFVAIIVLIMISSMTSGGEGVGSGILFLTTLIKGSVAVVILGTLGHYLLPKLDNFLSRSQELLFVFSLAWGFGFSLLFLYFGLSIEVGALLAGVLLSLAPYNHEISAKLKPLRDFFLIFFFMVLGSQMIFGNFSVLIIPIIIFSLLVVIGNPLIVMSLMGLMKYSKKTSFMSGLTVSQIGEFSLIVVALGVSVGHISQEILSLITLVSLMTIFGSTYLMRYSENIYEKISKPLSIFERKNIKEKEIPEKEYDYILLGYNRIGYSIIRSFSKITKNFLVVDYNLKVVKDLKKLRIPAVYGDASDSEFLEDLKIYKASVIVSTIPETETNKLILDVLKRNKSNTVTLLTGRQIGDAFELYKSGADYVIMPHFLGGEYASKLIESAKDNKKIYEKEKNKEMKSLKERVRQRQEHPRVGRG